MLLWTAFELQKHDQVGRQLTDDLQYFKVA